MGQLGRGLRRILDEVAADAATAEGPPAPPPMLVLENSPGSGDGIGSTIQDLADIVTVATDEGVAEGEFGFCLDIAHLWAAGCCLDGPAGVAELVAEIDERLGRRRVAMLHLNDARTVCGSRIDRHEHIGAGAIGEPACALCWPTRGWPACRPISRRPAWTSATTRSTWSASDC